MSPENLCKAIDKKLPITIVDVRSKMEFQSGHVPGAIHLPFYKAIFRASSVSDKRTKDVILYCEHGPRAYLAKLGFSLAGYRKVGFLKGHMHAWRAGEYPIQ